jgi:hypothetical protein
MTTRQPDRLQFPAFNPSPYRGLTHHKRAGNVLDFDAFLHGLVKATNRCKLPGLFIGTQTPHLDTGGFNLHWPPFALSQMACLVAFVAFVSFFDR